MIGLLCSGRSLVGAWQANTPGKWAACRISKLDICQHTRIETAHSSCSRHSHSDQSEPHTPLGFYNLRTLHIGLTTLNLNLQPRHRWHPSFPWLLCNFTPPPSLTPAIDHTRTHACTARTHIRPYPTQPTDSSAADVHVAMLSSCIVATSPAQAARRSVCASRLPLMTASAGCWRSCSQQQHGKQQQQHWHCACSSSNSKHHRRLPQQLATLTTTAKMQAAAAAAMAAAAAVSV